MKIKEKAYAKLNISLDVGKRREDGYHDMMMVMQTVSLCDELCLTMDDSGRVYGSTNLPFIPGDDRNLAVRAAKLYLDAVGDHSTGVHVEIRKNIPVGAGLGGGSADAAAVLRGMNAIFGERLSAEELEKLAAGVGSDVAFCVRGGTVLATGRGELLRPLTPMPDCSIVICKPEFSISTPELFRKLDQVHLHRHPDTDGILKALDGGDLKGICRRMYNVFEDVDDRRMRTVADIKSKLLDYGALGTVMTGTGSAVFGVFSRENEAMCAAEGLKPEYGFAAVAKPV